MNFCLILFSVEIAPSVNKLVEDDKCYYDIIVALDLDCMSYNENPAMFNFAKSLVNDIFNRFSKSRNIIANQGALRLGIVGFTDRLVIQMNLFEMSSLDGRLNAKKKALKAIEDLTNAQLSRQSNKSYFLHVFGWLSQLFDNRSHKGRELFIISNMVADPLDNRDWEPEDLQKLQSLKRRHFSDINIHTIAVNDQCDFNTRSSSWHEDCSYFKAFAVVEDNEVAKRQYRDGTRPVLVPSNYFRSASRRSDFSTFYRATLDKIDTDLSKDNLKKCRPHAITDCECAARVHLDCDVCEVGGAGPTGDVGPSGEAGPPGLPGLPGECGPAGPQGSRGFKGALGIDGVKGLPSPSPPDARSGRPGETGATGQKGNRGDQGLRGPDGQSGATGRPGRAGDPGATGSQGGPGQGGLRGERGQDGLTGDSGVKGAAGKNAIDHLRANKAAALADMKQRIKETVKDPNFKARVKAMSQQFVGLGNNGKTFVDCKDCDLPVCDPLPEPKCLTCETKHEVVLAVDNSQSVKNDEEVHQSINNVDEFFDELYSTNATGNAMFVHFASRLQTDAVVRIEPNDAVTYYNFTNWRDNPYQLPPRITTSSLVDTEDNWNKEKAKKYLKEFPFHENRYGEPVQPMERHWKFHNDNDVTNWQHYTKVRKRQAEGSRQSKFIVCNKLEYY